MLRLTVIDQENDRRDIRYGSEHELAEYLRDNYFPEPGSPRLDAIVQAMNDAEVFRVMVTPYEPSVEANRLPDNYLTHADEPAEDPWPRRGDAQE